MMGSGRNLAPQPAPPSRLSRSPTQATEASEATEATESRGSTTKFPSLKLKVSIGGYSIDGAVCGTQAAERISRLPELGMGHMADFGAAPSASVVKDGGSTVPLALESLPNGSPARSRAGGRPTAGDARDLAARRVDGLLYWRFRTPRPCPAEP